MGHGPGPVLPLVPGRLLLLVRNLARLAGAADGSACDGRRVGDGHPADSGSQFADPALHGGALHSDRGRDALPLSVGRPVEGGGRRDSAEEASLPELALLDRPAVHLLRRLEHVDVLREQMVEAGRHGRRIQIRDQNGEAWRARRRDLRFHHYSRRHRLGHVPDAALVLHDLRFHDRGRRRPLRVLLLRSPSWRCCPLCRRCRTSSPRSTCTIWAN